MLTFDIGNEITLSAAFTTASGTPVDPTTVVVRIKAPDGTIGVFTPTYKGVGLYSYNIVLDEPGYWYYRFEGSGAVIAANDGFLFVNNSPMFA